MHAHLLIIYRWEVVTLGILLLSIGAGLGFGFAKILR